jgi:hypothetical protein
MKDLRRVCTEVSLSLFAQIARKVELGTQRILLVLLLSTFSCCIWAQNNRIDTTPNGYLNPPQPAIDHAFVRDGKGILVADDMDYALDLWNVTDLQKRYGSVDVVMAQCHGGGFLDSIFDFGPTNYTFSSAARWDQPAWSSDTVGLNNPVLDNFTRAWRDSAISVIPQDMVDLFLDAAMGSPVGAPLVIRDSFAPLGADFTCTPPFINNGTCEFPQYESPGFFFGPNDQRDLGDLIVPQIGRQYVILVAWDNPNPRHQVNIIRLYQLLTNLYKVPNGHIAVLYGNPAPAFIGPFPAIGGGSGINDPARLPAVIVDGPNDLATWIAALNGVFFTDGGLPYQQRPGDRLLVYNTGHGGHTNLLLGRGVPIGPGIQFKITIGSGFYVSPTGKFQMDTSIADMSPDGSFTDSIQLTFENPVPAGTDLYINGQSVGEFGPRPGAIQPTTNPLPVGAPSGSISYQFTVPLSLLKSNLETITLFVTAPSDQVSLLNVDLRGGDQELLANPCGQENCPPY